MEGIVFTSRPGHNPDLATGSPSSKGAERPTNPTFEADCPIRPRHRHRSRRFENQPPFDKDSVVTSPAIVPNPDPNSDRKLQSGLGRGPWDRPLRLHHHRRLVNSNKHLSELPNTTSKRIMKSTPRASEPQAREMKPIRRARKEKQKETYRERQREKQRKFADHIPPEKQDKARKWVAVEIANTVTFINSFAFRELPDHTQKYHRRRLQGLQQSEAEKQVPGWQTQFIARFFERQHAARVLDSLEESCEAMQQFPDTQIPATKLSSMRDQIVEAEVDFAYTLYFPLRRQYERLYANPTRARTAYKLGKGIVELEPLKKTQTSNVWHLVRRCLFPETGADPVGGAADKTLDDLHNGRLRDDGAIKAPQEIEEDEKKWQIANASDLDVENDYERSDDEGGVAVDPENSDSDEEGGMRLP